MLHRRAPQQTIGSTAGRLLVVLAALAGLFAMHGLSDHGMAGTDAMSGMAMGTHAGHDAPPAASSSAATEAVSGHSSPGHDMGLMGLCLAVVVAAVATAVALLRLRVTRARSLLPAALPGLLGSARARVPRPPDLFVLSIQRC
ncbi:DUF6153 family protein [Nocardioides flavescens]|uniref:Uncharacterized protein n=1 Tax=Nocardioides flavescens TaxID=2691959 RepID=A0A6L7EQT8_9ACTN|nr:DUF6153 family protein [Nocardioides flavescens]MXG89000.1 hypothetical protein [Nocardioides flavescens]